MNKKGLIIAGVTEADFKKWCKDTGRPITKKESKIEFFTRIKDGRLVKDSSGKLVKKYKTRQ